MYGAETLLDNISEMGMKLSAPVRTYWTVCWKFVTPCILSALLVLSWVNFGHISYGNDGSVYPLPVQVLGYLITASTVLWIPVFAVVEVAKRLTKKTGTTDGEEAAKSLLRPTSSWGRQDQKDSRIRRPDDYESCQEQQHQQPD